MAEAFDPYHLWLGIPAKDQPPNHYRLLGIDTFESSSQVIDTAANRQITYLQAMASGAHRKEANQLLNEVAAARRCLLDANRRTKYDAKLKAKLDESVAVAEPVALAEPVAEVEPFNIQITDGSSKTAESKSKSGTDPKASEKKPKKSEPKTKAAKPETGSTESKPPLWKDWRVLAGAGVTLTLAIVGAVLFSGDADAQPGDGIAQTTGNDETAETETAVTGDELESKTESVANLDAKTDMDKLLGSTAKPNLIKDAKSSEDAASVAAAIASGTGLPNPNLKVIQHWEFNSANDVKSKVGLAKRQVELKGGPKFEDGPVAKGIVLDGVDDSIVLPPESVSPAVGSFSAWIQCRDARKQMIPILDSDPAAPYLLQLKPDMTLVATVGAGQVLTSSKKLKPGEWHHVGMSWESGAEAKLYVDGEEVASKKGIPELKPVTSLQLGAVAGEKPMFAAVAIDDVRFYRGLLGPSDISPLVARANRPKALPQGQLLASAAPVAAPKPTPPKPRPTPPKPTPPTKPKPKPKAPRKNSPRKPEPPTFPLLVNLGGSKVSYEGEEWIPGKKYQKGSWGYVGGNEKRGNALLNSAVENLSAFKADVPSGKYRVTMLFADMVHDKPGQRQFSFKVGPARPVNVDVVAFAGGKDKMVPSRPVDVPIRGGGTLEVTFSKINGSGPILNAIRIEKR